MDIKIPEVGESILEALVANWLKEDGAAVAKDDIICELETDKVNVELTAEASGRLHIVVPEGKTVPVGTLIATIEEGDVSQEQETVVQTPPPQKTAPEAETTSPPASEISGDQQSSQPPVNPAARQNAQERGINLEEISGSGRAGRILLDDVLAHEKTPTPGVKAESTKPVTAEAETAADGRPVTRQAMTPIRQRIAERLLQARQQTAMLTTFNEADMSWIKKIRSQHQEHFIEKHGIKLGLMSFFIKASIVALKEFPAVNARIDGTDIVYHHYYDIGIAVGTDRGLVVPVLRDADQMTFAEIEQRIADLAVKANARKLTLAELEGGTFTITNGGVYGSLLSTPIINPPQCGVLGMHSIQDRPVARNGEIIIRPIMNLALSYDHRLIDGREAVGFLKLIKEYIEDPSELFLEL
ncbi:MAG: 2-oxoglutarate dehydrogenase complex dihydrolipoyllysine-residue succinyltransferase [Desulfuromonadales bacterium]|nr:2-oxoglutarate dehydrogenase complex dihydrolipoyllysine-residue succinyltransferase [Desulfuromonadales bacterium]